MKTISQNTCLQCSKSQNTCCFHVNVPLTIKDLQRIDAFGFKRKDFILLGEYLPEDFEDQEKWWKESMISSKGKFFRININHHPNGSCFFLKEKEGCLLGKDRPTVCRIFPFWVEEENDKVIYELPHNDFCYMEKQKIPINLAVKLMGETEKSIVGLFNDIKEDCLKNKEKHHLILKELFPKEID